MNLDQEITYFSLIALACVALPLSGIHNELILDQLHIFQLHAIGTNFVSFQDYFWNQFRS